MTRGYRLACVDEFNERYRGNTPDGYKAAIEYPQRRPVGREVWCSTCGRMLDDRHFRASERRWVCWGYSGDGMDEHLAALLQVGPFVRPFDPARDSECIPMEGYRQIGPTTYERIASVDKDEAYASARRAEIEYFKKNPPEERR